MNYLCNAFSIQMLPLHRRAEVIFDPMSPTEAAAELTFGEWTSAIGHADTARIVGKMMGLDVPMNRVNVELKGDDVLIVAQVVGGRLPEGATELPEGIDIVFWAVRLKKRRKHLL